MPTANLKKYLGSSTSGVANSAIKNSQGGQQPCPANSATKQAYNKRTVNPSKTGTR